MSTIALPNTPVAIDADQLPEAFKTTGTTQKSRVTFCRPETTGAGPGLMTGLARLSPCTVHLTPLSNKQIIKFYFLSNPPCPARERGTTSRSTLSA
jgi:hypothetical protein